MNQTHIIRIVIAVVLVAGIVGCTLDAGNFVKVETPAPLVERGLAPKMTVNEAKRAYARITAEDAAALEEWGGSIQEGDAAKDRWNNIISLGTTWAAEQVSAFPLAAQFGIPALLGGLFGALGIRRPGDVSAETARTREHAEWNEALALGRKLGPAPAPIAVPQTP